MLKSLERIEDRSMPRLTGRFAFHTGQYLITQAGDVTGMDAGDRRRAWSVLDELVAKADPDSIVVDGNTARFLERRNTLAREYHRQQNQQRRGSTEKKSEREMDAAS